jgi:hypothetical protein
MSALRLITVVVVALPLFLMVGWPHPRWVTFLIALVACGAGFAVEALARRGTKPTPSDASKMTASDPGWEPRISK